MGRSDVFLKLEIIKKAYAIALLVIALVFFDSPIAIVATGIVSTIISTFVNAAPNKKLIGYSYWEQLLDIMPSFALSVVMLVIVCAIGQLSLAPIIVMLIQIPVGVTVYIVGSALFKIKPFITILSTVKASLQKRKQ
jgi:hypothetical protein